VRPQVSVVIAARNEAATLPTLLSGLLNQTYPHYEVIIVDDRSDDDTPELLRQWQWGVIVG
jgi:glycosyltransferase involved in cell wall biosynthesis